MMLEMGSIPSFLKHSKELGRSQVSLARKRLRLVSYMSLRPLDQAGFERGQARKARGSY